MCAFVSESPWSGEQISILAGGTLLAGAEFYGATVNSQQTAPLGLISTT